jgi:hypothetical protein
MSRTGRIRRMSRINQLGRISRTCAISREGTAVKGILGTALIGVIAMVAAGCSGGDDTPPAASPTTSASAPAANPTPSAAPASPAPLPAGFTRVSGTAFQFGLPAALKFVADGRTVTENGALERRWRYAVTPSGPFCVVVSVEQPRFTGQFPESVLQLFDAKTQPGQHTLRNATMQPAPPGTIGGVDQESTFTGTTDDGATFPSHLYQRKFLTPGQSLIALTVAGPQAQVGLCRYQEIIGTFSASGREFPGATPPAAG